MNDHVTLQDIARAANVSVSTVSRALSNSPVVTEKTRIRIQNLAQTMRYTPNIMARSLVKSTSNTIGMVIPDIMNPFFPEVAKGVEAYANQHGFNVLLCNSNQDIEKEKRYVENLFSLRVVGITIMPVTERLEHIFLRYPPDSNIAFLSYIPEALGCSGVEVDDVKSGYLATRHLVELGHQDIAFVGGGENSQITFRRHSGYEQALQEANIEPMTPGDGGESDLAEFGFNPGDLVFERRPLPTAIVAYNDVTALRVIETAGRRGILVPRDLSVVGIDDIYLSRLWQIQLTTVAQDKYRIGEWCARIVIDRFRDPETHRETVRKTCNPRLVVRNTTRAI